MSLSENIKKKEHVINQQALLSIGDDTSIVYPGNEEPPEVDETIELDFDDVKSK